MKFIADNMLGRLARYLRILGYDTFYVSSIDDNELCKKAEEEDRIILTRDARMIERKKIGRYIFIKSDYVLEQLKQIIGELNIEINEDEIFSRCLICNEEIINISCENVKGIVPEYVYNTQENFAKCSKCGKIYWRGTHFKNIASTIKRLKEL